MEEKIRSLIEKPVQEAGYIIDEITYLPSDKVLTIVIDKNGIITVDDCVTATKIINPILDEADPIAESYVLDVCSKEKGCE